MSWENKNELYLKILFVIIIIIKKLKNIHKLMFYQTIL